MKLTKRDDNLIETVNGKDDALFQHCAGGCAAVHELYFDSDVEPLLFLHGVAMTDCDWREE